MSRSKVRGDMRSQNPYVFLDYGGLIVDYQFTPETLNRAHNIVLERINSRRWRNKITMEQLCSAHQNAIQMYLADRNTHQVEWKMVEIMSKLSSELGLGQDNVIDDLKPRDLAGIYSYFDHNAELMPGAKESIDELEKVAKLGIISNLPHDSIRWELSRFGYRGSRWVFDPIVFSWEVGYRKPHPEIYQDALKRVNISDPQKAIFFSHDQIEVDGALAVGMQSNLTKSLTEVLSKLKTS